MTKRAGAAPTIVDVARQAGVSIKTVSRVMNKEQTVHPETRALVMRVVAALDYRPQLSARSLAGARSFLVGLLYHAPSAFYVAGVQRGALQRCREAGRHLVVDSMTAGDDDVPERVQAMLTTLRPDGVILTPPLCDDARALDVLRRSGTPTVLISPVDEGHGLPQVGMDDTQAGEEATRLLLELGHRSIAFVQGHQVASERRQQGYERALRAHGLAVDPADILPGRFDFDSGLAAARALLGRAVPPTAIFAANDDMALGAFAAAQQLGVPVPHGLSIVGFDDSRIATQVWPALTTVRQPLVEMAMAAVDLLLSDALKPGASGPPPVRVLPHALVVRGSTGAPERARP